ncbi:MAG: YHS domain-containing protein [Desulfobaccales bacterium]
MKKIGFLLAILALTLAMAGAVLAQGKAQTTCPVMGGNIDKNLYADYKGQRVYFCCTGCDAEFKKDPEKYLEKLKSQGVTPEKTPAGAGKKAK